MGSKQGNEQEIDATTEDIEENDGVEDFLKTMEGVDAGRVISNMTARRRIEELLEERRLREQIEDYRDWDA